MPEEPINEPERFTAEEWNTKYNNEGAWRDSIPKELSGHETMAKFNGKSPGEVVKSYIELEKSFGDRIPRPKADWTDEQKAEWYKEYHPGYPKESVEYKFHRAEGDYPFNQEDEDFFREIAHKNHLTVAQAENIWKEGHLREYERYMEAQAIQKEVAKRDEADLRKEWGSAYDERFALARGVLNKYASKELLDEMQGGYVSKDIWKFLAAVGENFTEDKLPEAKAKPTLRPAEALSKAKEYEMNNIEILRNERDPRYNTVMAERRRLYQLAYPEEQR